jgi:RNA polymerase sigma factor (sigma-70 family)
MSIQSFAFAEIPDDDEKPAPKANPAFRRLVHAYSGRAKLPMLAKDYERELIGQFQVFGCRDSLNQLIESHNGFLMNIISRVINQTGAREMADDLYNSAVEGFIKAVRNFDLELFPSRLSSYAKYYVAGEVRTFEMRYRRNMTFGTSYYDRQAYCRMGRIGKEFFEIYGRQMNKTQADLERASQISGLPEQSIQRAINARDRGRSIDLDRIQVIDHRTSGQPESELAKHQSTSVTRRYVDAHLGTLSERDADIVRTMSNNTLDAKIFADSLGKRHSITIERVRQIYRGALQKVRSDMSRDGIKHISDIA